MVQFQSSNLPSLSVMLCFLADGDGSKQVWQHVLLPQHLAVALYEQHGTFLILHDQASLLWLKTQVQDATCLAQLVALHGL